MKKIICISLLAAVSVLLGCSGEENYEALAQKGRDALNNKDYNEALHNFQKALHLKPSDRDMLYSIGLAFKGLEMPDSAISYLGRADVLYPSDREINEELLRLCPLVEDYECALTAVKTLIATGDNEEMFYIFLADFNYFLGNNFLAEKYYRLLIKEQPNETRYYINLADALTKMQKYDESTKVLLTAMNRFGPNPFVFSNIAANYVPQKKFAEAEKYLRKAVEFDPNSLSLLINLAHVLSAQDDKEKKREAIMIYRANYMDIPNLFNVDSLINVLEKEIENMP